MHANLPKSSSSFAFCNFKTLSRSRLCSKFPSASTVTIPRTSKVRKESEDEDIHTSNDMQGQFLYPLVHNTVCCRRTQSELCGTVYTLSSCDATVYLGYDAVQIYRCSLHPSVRTQSVLPTQPLLRSLSHLNRPLQYLLQPNNMSISKRKAR